MTLPTPAQKSYWQKSYRLMFYVQHLLGIGHLVRSLRLAHGFVNHGFEVLVVSGGEPLSSFDWGTAKFHQLPPVKITPPDFSTLLNPDGTVFTEVQKHSRAQELIAMFDDFAPDVLVLEAFPFGRRQMRFELLPLLDRAQARQKPPLIATSVRDILQAQKKPERVQEMLDMVTQYCDLVLVHGDEQLIALEASFPRAQEIADRLVYTGLVAPVVQQPQTADNFDIIVSVGGGAVGANLLSAALEAQTLLAHSPTYQNLRWLFLTGPNMPSDLTQKLEANGNSAHTLTIATFRPDLPALLHRAKLSISQAGYNTVVDLLCAKCRAVLVPFADHGESEQTIRAQKLAAANLAVCLAEAALTAQNLNEAIKHAFDLPDPHFLVRLDGAKISAKILQSRLAAKAT